MLRAVVFDIGGVLTPPLDQIVLPAVLASGVDPEALRAVLLPMFASPDDGDLPAHRWERGEIDLDGFLALMGPAGATVRPVIDPASPTFLARDLAPHAGMQAFVAEVRAAGLRTAVISNVVPEWIPAWRSALPDPTLFDHIVLSCDAGCRKPNPAIYRLVLDRLGVAPHEAVLLDDFPPMVDGARAVGMHAIEVRDHERAMADVRVLLAASAA